MKSISVFLKKRKIVSCVLVMLAIVALCGIVGYGQNRERMTSQVQAAANPGGDMAVHFLDVGQGLAILVQSGGQNLLYDGGGTDSSRYVVSYLRKQGVEKIDYMISSHYDDDHISGLIGCLNAFSVNCVIASDYAHDSKTYKTFMKVVSEKELSPQYPEVGTEYTFGTGKFVILSPSVIDANDSNNNSVAIKLVNGVNSFVFTGDAEYDSEESMCKSKLDLSCDVLVVGHHGSASSTCWDFLQKTLPDNVVISCGTNNSYGHPDQDTMEKLESINASVYRTDKQGTIIALSNGTSLTWNQPACNDYSPGVLPGLETTPAVNGTDSGDKAIAAGADTVWASWSGTKYHNKPNCGTMNPSKARQMTKAEAEAEGLSPCKKCYH